MINLRSIKKGDVLLGTESDERFLVVSTGEKLSGDGFTTIQFTLLKNGSAVVASESISYDVYKRNPEATPLVLLGSSKEGVYITDFIKK